MGLAMKKFRRMSLPSMAITVAALQTEFTDTDSRIQFLGKSPAAVAARNYGTKLAQDLKVRTGHSWVRVQRCGRRHDRVTDSFASATCLGT